MRHSHSTSVLLFAALITACDSGSPTTPTSSLDADLGVVEVVTGGLSAYSAAGTGYLSSGGFAPALRSMQPSACAYNDATQFFTCPTVSSGGYMVARKFRLLDASGVSVSSGNPETITAIRSVIDVQGGPARQALISRHEDNTLSGLRTATRTLNGTSTQDLTLFDADGGVAMMTHDMSVTTDLTVLNSVEQRYPLGGTIVSDGTMTYGTSGTSFPYHREIIFDGSNIMTMKQSTSGGSTMTCKLPLAPSSGTVTCTFGSTGL